MRSNILRKILLMSILCLFCAQSWAIPVENSVVVEIDTLDMEAESVENVISDPVEILLGSLEGVYFVSAKYSLNKAIINVRFSETSDDPDTLVKLVRVAIDSFLDKLPDNIDSISVSLGEPSDVDDQPVEQKPDPEKTPPPELEKTEDLGASSKIRVVEKRTRLGRYLGSIESSNEFLPIITTLKSTSSINDDVGSGKYIMSEQEDIVRGEVFDCYNNAGNALTCKWRDKYGMGGVDFIFTPDYSSFSGRWSINGTDGTYKWSGIKVEEN